MTNILVVEDNAGLRRLIGIHLRRAGYEVSEAADGQAALDLLEHSRVHLIITDVMMPRLDGYGLIRELREAGDTTPVLMVTVKDSFDDMRTGFHAGADDYLPKPFEPDELIARVRAMLRRGGAYTPAVLTFGDVSLDTGSGLLSCAGQSIRLSGREFQVMELFLRHVRVVLSADRIMERVWGWDSDAEINVVWVHISNLRKKLRAIGSTVTIRANRGLGSVLESSHD